MSTIIVNVDRVIYHHAAELILDGVSWEIQAGQKIGLVGPNGAGKSTLLRLIAGELTPDSGLIARHKTRIGYLAQEPRLDPALTVWETVVSANAKLHAIEAKMRRLEAQMGDPAITSDERAFERVLAAHARAQEAFERGDGYRYESRCRQALQTVGFADADFDLPTTVLSGGQKKMLGLARLLAIQCDLLLLDEPDNHLDLAGKAHLERFIHAFDGAIIIVSHDRYLLDETVDQIAEVEDHRLTLYLGNYSPPTPPRSSSGCCASSRRTPRSRRRSRASSPPSRASSTGPASSSMSATSARPAPARRCWIAWSTSKSR